MDTSGTMRIKRDKPEPKPVGEDGTAFRITKNADGTYIIHAAPTFARVLASSLALAAKAGFECSKLNRDGLAGAMTFASKVGLGLENVAMRDLVQTWAKAGVVEGQNNN